MATFARRFVTPHRICAHQAHAALMVLRRGYAAPQHHQFLCGRDSLSHTLTVRSVVAGNKIVTYLSSFRRLGTFSLLFLRVLKAYNQRTAIIPGGTA
ncbi:hypothetical protein K2Z83_08000 [Oscillochloris sp. ZM17-4]|uniref:hypothetical protein n=1 Tax=Oscillochloris sp. ZM17-4 TaxID=2866714 RepID=UPI001C7349B3|nr:hypothetical protein [Oscillochloris sp. ZM17-4]MBX0327618.1 hypothetical protein [Oscillochloris sp. ZM17-4]